MTRSKRKGRNVRKQSARTDRGAERGFFLLSRLMRGSTALVLLEAASGSHFLYFSTEQRHTKHTVIFLALCREILVSHVMIKVIVNIFGLNLFTFFLKNNLTMKQKRASELASLENVIPFIMSPSTGCHQYYNTEA